MKAYGGFIKCALGVIALVLVFASAANAGLTSNFSKIDGLYGQEITANALGFVTQTPNLVTKVGADGFIGDKDYYVWSKDPVYNLNQSDKVVVSFSCKPGKVSGCGVAFSANRRKWSGSEKSDALTFSIVSQSKANAVDNKMGISLRTGMFEKWLASDSSRVLADDKWVEFKVVIRADRFQGYVDGDLVMEKPLGKDDIPVKGYIGFVGWHENGKVQYKEIQVVEYR